MIRTVEAVVHSSGNARLLEEVQLPEPRRPVVTILEDAPRSEDNALLSEAGKRSAVSRGRHALSHPQAHQEEPLP